MPKVLLGFYGSLAYGMSRGTYSGAEVTLMKSGKNFVQLPHLYSGTQQLRLLRNILVREDDRRLILAQAVPRAWLADGKSMRVRNAATFFGPVGYAIESRVNEGKILISLDPPTADPPQSIELHLRHPDLSKVIQSVTVNGVESYCGGNADTVSSTDLLRLNRSTSSATAYDDVLRSTSCSM